MQEAAARPVHQKTGPDAQQREHGRVHKGAQDEHPQTVRVRARRPFRSLCLIGCTILAGA